MFGCEDKRQEIFGCTPSNEHELTHFDTTDLHDLQTGFQSIDFSADRSSIMKYHLSQILVGRSNIELPTLANTTVSTS